MPVGSVEILVELRLHARNVVVKLSRAGHDLFLLAYCRSNVIEKTKGGEKGDSQHIPFCFPVLISSRYYDHYHGLEYTGVFFFFFPIMIICRILVNHPRFRFFFLVLKKNMQRDRGDFDALCSLAVL